LLKSNRLTLFILVFALSAIYFFVFGESGIIMRMELSRQRVRLVERIDDLKDEGQRLKALYGKYRKGEMNREEARIAGFIEQGERIVFVRGGPIDQASRAGDVKEDGTFANLDHLRILWVVISVLAVFLFLARMHRKPEDPAAL
jgi:cell division protein FtsB